MISSKEISQIKQILDILRDIWQFAEEWVEFIKKSGVTQLKQLNQEDIVTFTHKKENGLKKMIMNQS